MLPFCNDTKMGIQRPQTVRSGRQQWETEQEYKSGFSQNSCAHYIFHEDENFGEKDDVTNFWVSLDLRTGGRFSSLRVHPSFNLRTVGKLRALGIPPIFKGLYQKPEPGSPDLGKLGCDLCKERLQGGRSGCSKTYDSYFRSFNKEQLDQLVEAIEKWDQGVEQGERWKGFATRASLGYGPPSMQHGDSVWFLGNDPQPFILRPIQGGGFEVYWTMLCSWIDSARRSRVGANYNLVTKVM
jgi:hypothetical protein